MIIGEFTVNVRGRRWKVKAIEELDSQLVKGQIEHRIREMLSASQSDALCESCGIDETVSIPNQTFGIFDEQTGTLEGAWLNAVPLYLPGGPWDNTVDWNVINPGATAVLDCRPSPMMIPMSADEEGDIAVEIVHHMFAKPMTTADGNKIRFREMQWAIFLDGTDPISERAKVLHGKAKGHAKLDVKEIPDPTKPGRTLATLKLK